MSSDHEHSGGSTPEKGSTPVKEVDKFKIPNKEFYCQLINTMESLSASVKRLEKGNSNKGKQFTFVKIKCILLNYHC